MSILFPGDEGLSFDDAIAAIERHNPRTGDGDRRRHEEAQAAATRAAALLTDADLSSRFDAIDKSPEFMNFAPAPASREARESYSKLTRPLDYLSVEQQRRRNPPLEGSAKLFRDFLMSSPERDVGAGRQAFGGSATPRQLAVRVLATHGREGFDQYQTAKRALRGAERRDRAELGRLMDKRAAGRMTSDERADLSDLEHRLEPHRAAVKAFESTAGASFTGQALAGPMAGGEAVADNGELVSE